jgi:DNA (cytosine-5)-methyltransferase 1
MIRDQLILDINDELIVVLFAGFGGMCHAIERALGRHVDIACNHNAFALAGHRINHPQTKHYQCDVYELDPREACGGRKVGLLHLSPDCTHFSQAAEGQPRDAKIRSLSWVALMWAGTVQPRIITLENVKQIRKWGPLIAKRDKTTGRCLKVHRRPDGSVESITVAEPGERVPVQQQFLIPDPAREGTRWRRLLSRLESEGYHLEDEDMVAADYGAPTTRDRLYMVARSDAKPVVWPERSHAKKPVGPQKKWRAAAECIDWTIPVPSIFSRKRPLVESTCRRLAKGVMQFVIEHPDPFIVPLTHHGSDRLHGINEPFRTITGANRGELALAVPMVAPICQYNGGNIVRSAADPFGTMTAKPKGGHYALAAAFLAQHNAGNNTTAGHDARRPFSTLTTRGTQQQLVTAHLAHFRRNCAARDVREPVRTISAKGQHHALVECNAVLDLTPEQEAGALRCAAFLIRYYSTGGQWGDLRDPMAAVTTKDRLALVTVWIQGIPRVIVDIGMRMFAPRELALGMGFLPSFIIDRGVFLLPDGRTEERALTRTTQIELIGNAVSPNPAEALVLANAPELSRYAAGERLKVLAG